MLEERRHWGADYREDGASKPVDIRVIGIGGAGGNAINRMVESEITGVELIAINTDAQALSLSKATKKLQIGVRLTNGRGAGGNPQIGRQAAEEDRQQIASLLENAEMVFLAAGMGGRDRNRCHAGRRPNCSRKRYIDGRRSDETFRF